MYATLTITRPSFGKEEMNNVVRPTAVGMAHYLNLFRYDDMTFYTTL